jgi:tetratricopeptide (TPR) repeat protein
LFKLERYQESEATLRRALSLDPGNADTRYDLALALYQLKKFEESISVLKSIAGWPGRADVHIAVALSCRGEGRVVDAVTELREALQVEPENSEAYLQLSVAYGEDSKWEESLAAGKRLVELRPKDEVGYWAVAGAYHELKQYPEEIDVCNQALRINPDSLPALEGLANAYAETARYEEAATALRHAIKISPHTPHLRAWLAQSYVELGDLRAAKEEQRALQRLDSGLAADVAKRIATRTERAE